jgi:hypothetical protein
MKRFFVGTVQYEGILDTEDLKKIQKIAKIHCGCFFAKNIHRIVDPFNPSSRSLEEPARSI